MKQKSKITNIILFVSLLINLLLFYKTVEYVKNEKEERIKFIDSFASTLSEAEGKLHYILNNNIKGQELPNQIGMLSKDIDDMMYFLGNGNYLSGDKLDRVYINNDYYLMNGFEIEVGGKKNINVSPFGEDGKIDEREATYLIAVDEILTNIKEKLYTNKNKLKEDIDYKELQKIIKELYVQEHGFERIFIN